MEANNDLAGANSKLKEQRAVLGHASAQLKAIEKLRERRFERHQQQLKREEQAGADEIAIRMFDRSSQTCRRRVVGHVVEGAV
jgi:flagellar export protein FliJ